MKPTGQNYPQSNLESYLRKPYVVEFTQLLPTLFNFERLPNEVKSFQLPDASSTQRKPPDLKIIPISFSFGKRSEVGHHRSQPDKG